MGMVKVPKGKKFIKKNERMNQLYLVVQGKVQQICGKNSYLIESGNLVGLAGCDREIYLSDYVTLEECVLYTFPYEKPENFRVIFESQPKYAVAFLQAAVRQTVGILEQYQKMKRQGQEFYHFIMGSYRQYSLLCEALDVPEKMPHQLEKLEKLHTEDDLGEWEIAYFRELSGVSSMGLEQFYGKNNTLVIGEILRAANVMNTAVNLMEKIREYLDFHKDILLRERKSDLFELYQELAMVAAGKDKNLQEILAVAEKVKAFIRTCGLYQQGLVALRLQEFDSFDFEAIRQKTLEERELLDSQTQEDEGEDCLVHILAYAGYQENKIEHVREILSAYQELDDDYATDDSARKIRREITTVFYDVYKKVFHASLKEEKISPIIQMFLTFGFLDVQTAGEENANELYDLVDELDVCRSEHVYTMYDWLYAIYKGEQEPSRNEFDLDYNGYLHEQKRMGRITEADEMRLRDDNWEKVVYEIDNMFASANRATYGKLSTFCPVLSSGDVVGDIKNMLVTAEKLEDAMNAIRGIDFSLFYHEVIFSDPAHGVNKELIQKEILPDFILMPNIGTRAMMWQETAGLKRDTSARFVFSILTAANLEEMMLTVCGRYRWEICRKIQGMRWNDITESSLTSEYCDYIQFYRKNHELSVDAKDKIKNALTRAKNNYREVFVMDYISWIRYESNGSFRLNKIARDIIFRYCPFNREIRDSLTENPMYQDIFSKYRIQMERKVRHMKAFTDKYVKSGGTMTPELEDALEFFDK